MRNLISFIWKNYFFFLFLLLEVISVALIVQNNSYQRAGFINSSNYVVGSVLQSYSNVTDYFSLKEANEQIAKENALLRSSRQADCSGVYAVRGTVSDTILKQKYRYVTGKVVGNTTNRRNNYITLNIGEKQGITPDMGVISPEGVIGIVKNVSENFSSVMSLLNSKTVISCKLKKDGSFGPLSWDGSGYDIAILKDIPAHVKLAKGDTVTTSAYSSTYPENVPVGTVDSYEKNKGEYFYTIRVKLSTNFKKLNSVYVVQNILKGEQDTLEQTQKDDK